MGFLGFLGKKKFYISLGIAVVITIVFVVLLFQYIRSYTRHGEALVLPDFTGRTLQEVKESQYNRLFDFIITDSIFSNGLEPGSIVKQNPSPLSKVKEGRNIYITVVAATPEMTVMPDLRDLTVRQAMSSLKINHLKVGKLLFHQDMADNAVLGQYFNGDTLLTGDTLLSGSEINLLIGKANNNPSPIPFLISRKADDAIDLIHISAFNVGRVIYWDSLARLDGKVYRQMPEWTDELQKGKKIDIWLKSPTQLDFDSLVQALLPDSTMMEEHMLTLPEDSLIFEE